MKGYCAGIRRSLAARDDRLFVMPKYCIACSLKSSTIPNMQSQRLIPWLIFSFSQAAYRCSITDLFERHPSLDDFIQDNTRTFPDLKNVNWNKIHAACRWAEQDHHHILPFNHADYPALLKHIAHPPPLLYVKGNIQHLQLTTNRRRRQSSSQSRRA